MIKEYNVHIPPHLFDVLQEIGHTTSEDFDTVITASRTALFNFNYPVPQTDKEDLETFIMNYFILRRIGSGNVRKWRQMFKSKILEIMPYYGKLLESEHLEYDPLINNDIETTDYATGTLDTTRDKRTDNDYAYQKAGNSHTVEDVDEAMADQYVKNGTSTKDITKSGTNSNQYAKSGTESANSTELNRYMDTPQGDSSRVWETDAQGHIRLTDYYITDVRGITNNATRTWSEAGNDSGTTGETVDEDDTFNEAGNSSGTHNTDRDVSVTYAESGTDNRDIVEHETVDTDTTNSAVNNKLGVSNSSKSKLVTEFRETFLRIYTDITVELEPLFYNLVEIDDILDFV